MNRKQMLRVVAALALVVLVGCAGFQAAMGIQPNQPVGFPAGTVVYSVGRVGTDAAMWRNGELTILPNGGSNESWANEVAVLGNDVLIAGRAGANAVYWRNGELFVLDVGDMAAGGATSIHISGNDVFLAGWIGDSIFHPHAVYWKNGELISLPHGPHDGGRAADASSARSIFVVNNDVFIAGDTILASGNPTIPNIPNPTLWRNGVPVALRGVTAAGLPGITFTGSAISVSVSGDDVYVAGRIGNVPHLWRNGQIVYLPAEARVGDGSRGATHLNSLFASGNNVYVAGEAHTVVAIQQPGNRNIHGLIATWWRVGERRSRPITHLIGMQPGGRYNTTVANSVFVLGNDVFVGGRTMGADRDFATLWVNGLRIGKPVPNGNSVINDIAVVRE